MWPGVRCVHKVKNVFGFELMKDTSVKRFVASLPIANGINDTKNVAVSAMCLSEGNIW